MAENERKAYLVIRRSDGLGNVFALRAGKRYVLGRAKTNEIVLQDELCSRQHSEVYFAEGRWLLRDCGSLNGTRLNEVACVGEQELIAGDEIGLGHTRLVFVEDLSQLPTVPMYDAGPALGVSIKQRLGQTRFETAPPPANRATPPTADRQWIGRDLSLLYRLALNMGAAATSEELVEVVLEGLLEATAADVAAVLTLRPKNPPQLIACRGAADPNSYTPPSDYIIGEVVKLCEGVLAEDAARLRAGGVSAMSSLICAPVLIGAQVDSLLHLYCTDPLKSLSGEDLELAVAVGKQMAVASQALRRQNQLREENQRLKAQVVSEVQLVGESPAIQEITAQIARVADTNAIVLLRGESGSGKELVARALHLASPRRQQPFVCLNCAALAESLLESELFGHEKGAFTGATERKIGKFEAAHGGTIFLDEIGEMNLSAQAKLLRVLEGHPYERVGGSEPIRVNVRVIAATNRPLEEAVATGQFRRDLYFRLQVVEIRVPPLRERRSDIPLLAEHFLTRFLAETGRKIRGFTPAAKAKLESYDWPGNVRELRNVVERAVALSSGPMIDAGDIWLSGLDRLAAPAIANPADDYRPISIEALEKQHILRTLQHTGWNKSQAANILGIERSTLDRKIKAYAIQRGT